MLMELVEWSPNDSLSDDANMMDLVMLVTRTSALRQGGMGCVLLATANSGAKRILDRIIAITTNQSLYKERQSDIHAEVAAIGVAAAHGIATARGTAYITMPPCTNCFAAICASGITRVVSRYPPKQKVALVAEQRGIEFVALPETEEQRQRIKAHVAALKEKYGDVSQLTRIR